MSWNKIDNLLKKVEAFYKNALWSELVSKAQHNKKDINAARWDGKSEDANKETAAEKASRLWLEQEEEKLRNKGKPAPVDIPEAPEPVKPEAPAAIDLGMYNKIVSFAKEPSAQGVRDELNDIAQLYKNACEGNAKFSTVSTAVGKFINKTLKAYYDEFDNEADIEEGEEGTTEQKFKRERDNVEDFMTDIYNDVSIRYKHQVNIEKGLVAPTAQAPVTVDPDEEEELKKKTELEEDTDPGAPKVVFDKSDFGGGDMNPGKKQGASAQGERNYKDWIKSCEKDILKHNEDLKNVKEDKFKKILVEKINVLNQLLPFLKAEKKMLEDPSVARAVENRRTVPTDPEVRQEFDSIKENEKLLKDKNNYLKSQLKTLSVIQENEELNKKLNSSRSQKEKAYLTQQIELNNLIASPDKNKVPEIEARMALIKAMLPRAPEMDKRTGFIEDRPEVYLNNINPAMMAKYLQDIQDAASNKLSLSDWYKQEAAKLKVQKGVIEVYDPITGAKKRNQYNEDVRKLDGWITQLQSKYASIRKVPKDKLIKELGLKWTSFQPYIDAVGKAEKTRRDWLRENPGKKSADKEKKLEFAIDIARVNLKQAIENEMKLELSKSMSFKQYVTAVRRTHFLLKYKDNLSQIKKMGVDDDDKVQLSKPEGSLITNTILLGNRIIKWYKELLSWGAPTSEVEKINNYLQSLFDTKGGSNV